MRQSAYRSLPSVEKLLTQPGLAPSVNTYPREVVVDVVREKLDAARLDISMGGASPTVEELVLRVADGVHDLFQPTLRPVINATGVILHTNLGRAPLSAEAVEAAWQISKGYSNLELDLISGGRGSRHTHVEALVRRLTGAEAAIVVNNNASAVLLALMAIARGREVVVSRGESIEIGGGFRIPDVLRQSGATLVEVGTTNRTYVRDFDEAVVDETAAFLRVHSSNFKVMGFVHTPSILEMAEAAARHRVMLIHDIGSGCLLDTRLFGLSQEPTPQESVSGGADLTLFSGDKLLGGPQAGIIVGKRSAVETLKQHPLARAVRLDKSTLASLATTLLHYARGEAAEKIPIWRMIAASPRSLERRARKWAQVAGGAGRVMESVSTIGGGSLPGEVMPTHVAAIDGTGGQLLEFAARLRQGTPAVMARIEQDRLLFDPRTVLPDEDGAVLSALERALRPG